MRDIKSILGMITGLVVIAILVAMALETWGEGLPDPITEACNFNSNYDGDTIRATCGGKKTTIRFYCIDTPEMSQKPWGKESHDHLRRIVPKDFDLKTYKKDRYGRTVGEVFAGETSINLQMVRDGMAAVYPRYCKEQRFFDAELQARDKKQGIWSKSGLHQTPWEYRQRKRNENS